MFSGTVIDKIYLLVQTHKSLRCSYTQSKDVDEDSSQILDLSTRLVHQHRRLKVFCADMRLVPRPHAQTHIISLVEQRDVEHGQREHCGPLGLVSGTDAG